MSLRLLANLRATQFSNRGKEWASWKKKSFEQLSLNFSISGTCWGCSEKSKCKSYYLSQDKCAFELKITVFLYVFRYQGITGLGPPQIWTQQIWTQQIWTQSRHNATSLFLYHHLNNHKFIQLPLPVKLVPKQYSPKIISHFTCPPPPPNLFSTFILQLFIHFPFSKFKFKQK